MHDETHVLRSGEKLARPARLRAQGFADSSGLKARFCIGTGVAIQGSGGRIMNSRFLASPGGRFANAALSLAFLVAAFAAFSDGKGDAIRGVALGLLAITAGFIVAAVLSVEKFHGYSLAVGLLVPMAGFYYVCGLQLVMGAGAGAGSAFATMGIFVLIAGIVLGLRTSRTSEVIVGSRAHPATTSNVSG